MKKITVCIATWYTSNKNNLQAFNIGLNHYDDIVVPRLVNAFPIFMYHHIRTPTNHERAEVKKDLSENKIPLLLRSQMVSNELHDFVIIVGDETMKKQIRELFSYKKIFEILPDFSTETVMGVYNPQTGLVNFVPALSRTKHTPSKTNSILVNN